MGTWLVGAVVLVIIALAVRKIYRDKKAGKACGSCDGCTKCRADDNSKL